MEENDEMMKVNLFNYGYPFVYNSFTIDEKFNMHISIFSVNN